MATSNHSFVFTFEKEIDIPSTKQWLNDNWHCAFYIGAIYGAVLLAGQRYMKHRQPLQLRKYLFVWNLGLAIFSICGTVRMLPGLISVLARHGWRTSVCQPRLVVESPVLAFWAWLFLQSKVLELGDSMFMILRKQPVIFLHWYHHMIVLLSSWYVSVSESGPELWCIVMNYTVHSFMYSYFALKVMRVPIPRFVSMIITTMQLAQMVVGVYIAFYCYSVLKGGEFCGISNQTLSLAFSVYLSFVLLFGHFFYSSYIRDKSRMKKEM